MASGSARRLRENRFLFIVIFMALCYGSYFVLRYLGLWMEQDTAQFVNYIASMRDVGRINHPGAYTHGYAYSTWAVILQAMTGVGVANLTQLFLPLVGNLLLAIMGLATFTHLLRSPALAALTVSIYFLVPELLFTVSRGNHEKLSLALVLLSALALAKSLPGISRETSRTSFISWSIIFYFAVFTSASLNGFFGSTFMVTVTLSLSFLVIASLFLTGSAPVHRRLLFKASVGWLMIILVIFFVYPRSRGVIGVVGTGLETALSIFEAQAGPDPASAASQTVSPYAVISGFWRSTTIYRVLSSFRWLLLTISFTLWATELWSALRHSLRIPLERLLLIAYCGAFGFQLMLSIPIDFLGTTGGNNLQVRLYPYFALFAAPFVALGLARLSTRPVARSSAVRGLFVAAFCGFAVLSALKATLDPGVSNNWLFYEQHEVVAIDFWERRYSGVGSVWVSPGGRLRHGYVGFNPNIDIEKSRMAVGHPERTLARFALYSPTVLEEMEALQVGGPPLWLASSSYDNGESKLYFAPP